MPTAESVKAKLQGLINKANSATGKTDDDLTKAVDSLCDGYGGYDGDDIALQEKTVTPTEAKQTIEADDGYDALSKVTVEAIPSEYVIPSGTKEITANGTYDVKGDASVDVNVELPPVPQWDGTGVVIAPIPRRLVTTDGYTITDTNGNILTVIRR